MRILVTGGAGFIGAHLSDYLVSKGHQITILDNLSRPGTERNWEWLQEKHCFGLRFVRGDIRDKALLQEVIPGHQVIFHLAAQVAVTQSVRDPQTDFEINAWGTLNLLEVVRKEKDPPAVIFTSTNKVYGSLERLKIVEKNTRYEALDSPSGISEDQPLDFYSPYGCSKGSADQYVLDYSRIYGLRTVVFRMSCIYGPRQFGNEDQGWVAHFVISWCKRRPLTIYGNGKQVRDVLFISDLMRAFELVMERIDQASGLVFNIGGGPFNALSLIELVETLKTRLGYFVPLTFKEWRPGDQKHYISNISRAKAVLGWEPTITKEEGLECLINWVRENSLLF